MTSAGGLSAPTWSVVFSVCSLHSIFSSRNDLMCPLKPTVAPDPLDVSQPHHLWWMSSCLPFQVHLLLCPPSFRAQHLPGLHTSGFHFCCLLAGLSQCGEAGGELWSVLGQPRGRHPLGEATPSASDTVHSTTLSGFAPAPSPVSFTPGWTWPPLCLLPGVLHYLLLVS